MKEKLRVLFEDNKGNFSFFKENVDKQKVSSIWGIGVIPPYSILPFYSEMLGNKPGRFLKKSSQPGKNRQCYLLNINNEIINSIVYDEFSRFNNQWIVSNKFYFYSPNSIIQYSFGTAFEHESNAKLNSVTFAQIEEDKIVKAFILGSRNEYEELEYLYHNNEIYFIKQKSWLEVYFERNYKIVHGDHISIYEILNNGKMEIIYPIQQ